MTSLEDVTDSLHRTVKLALDTGEAATVEEAERIFAGYRMQILLGPAVADSPALQAAALTAVNCAARTLLGGVSIVGASGPLRVILPPFREFGAAIAGLGGRLAAKAEAGVPTLVIGDVSADDSDPLAVRAAVVGWSGGVMPLRCAGRMADTGDFTPAGVLAGSLGVSEIFQHLRGGNPAACRRAIGLNLWRPEQDWLRGETGPAVDCLPSSAWLVGLGNLGQAYLWCLGLLPYGDKAAGLVLQDVDFLARSNLSTSLLTQATLIGRRKTRAMAEWAEARGFRTTIVERGFAADFRVGAREPAVGLIGVDNALARSATEHVGFGRIIEAGLGRGPQDFLGIDVHTFPASKPAREVWRDAAPEDAQLTQPAYRAMLDQTGDRCGTVRVAGRSVGAPFVGAIAASLVIAELLRLGLGQHRYEIISCHLRDLGQRTAIPGPAWNPFNPGVIALAA